MVSVSKNRVVMSKICIIIPITCFLFFDCFWPFSPSRQLGHLGCCPFQVEHFDHAEGCTWAALRLNLLNLPKSVRGRWWCIITGEYAAVPPFVFYVCLLLFRNNRKTSFLEKKTAATGRVPISSRRTPSIKSAVRKNITVNGRQFFLGKVEGTLADVERI